MLDIVIEWLKKYGVTTSAAIDLGLLAYALVKRLAEREGVDPAEFAKREADAMARLGHDSDALLDELRELTK